MSTDFLYRQTDKEQIIPFGITSKEGYVVITPLTTKDVFLTAEEAKQFAFHLAMKSYESEEKEKENEV